MLYLMQRSKIKDRMDLIAVYRDLFVIKTTTDAKKYLDLTDAESEELSSLASLFTKETLLSHCKMLDNAFYTMQRGGSSKRMIAEMSLVRMCDEALDTSAEALLSRLSKLEDAVRVASFSSFTTPSTATVNESVGEAPKEQRAEIKEDKPAIEVKEAVKEPVKEKSVEPPKVQKSSGKPTLRAIRCKMEVADKVAQTDIPASSFIKSANMYEGEGGKIILKLSNNFAVMMLSRAATKDALKNALSACLLREVRDADIVIELSDGNDANKYDILDELTED